MKRYLSVLFVAVLAMTLVMTACSTHEFSGSSNDEKTMTITAKNADAGDFFMTGSLVVDEGETIKITPALEKGSVKLEFISAEGNDSIDELPELDGEAIVTANVSGTEEQGYGGATGSFMVKATVTEKATGTIDIIIE